MIKERERPGARPPGQCALFIFRKHQEEAWAPSNPGSYSVKFLLPKHEGPSPDPRQLHRNHSSTCSHATHLYVHTQSAHTCTHSAHTCTHGAHSAHTCTHSAHTCTHRECIHMHTQCIHRVHTHGVQTVLETEIQRFLCKFCSMCSITTDWSN